MSRIMRLALASMVALLVALLGVSPAWAHYPFCSCAVVEAAPPNSSGTEQDGGTIIECTGGFSDGSSAAGVRLDVLARDGRVLQAGRLDGAGTLRFSPPEEPFTVLFEAGPGMIVDLDASEIRGLMRP